MDCHFCGRFAEKTCTRPVLRSLSIPQAELGVGDYLHLRWQDEINRMRTNRAIPGKFGCSTAEVLNVVRRRSDTMILLPAIYKGMAQRAVFVPVLSRLKVDRPGVCDLPCCYLHRAEPGSNTTYCMEHWQPGLEHLVGERETHVRTAS